MEDVTFNDKVEPYTVNLGLVNVYYFPDITISSYKDTLKKI